MELVSDCKRCACCKEYFGLTEFHCRGREAICKECKKQRNKRQRSTEKYRIWYAQYRISVASRKAKQRYEQARRRHRPAWWRTTMGKLCNQRSTARWKLRLAIEAGNEKSAATYQSRVEGLTAEINRIRAMNSETKETAHA